ncbi:hypothetical protein B0I21_107244 [Sphingobacterium paludis]|uniref:Uncharacterized protein n=1 Tax=Sphingobacterium paludis TaxID=1476465 RepID=A0A4R7CVP3_9SPHI|nr:hypothetical protein B0I21_107244 [Sphingobacterium paludis]
MVTQAVRKETDNARILAPSQAHARYRHVYVGIYFLCLRTKGFDNGMFLLRPNRAAVDYRDLFVG